MFPIMLPRCLLVLTLAMTAIYSAAEGLDAQFSGFGRIVTGQIDDSGVSYSGYDDNFTFDQNSLLGLQGQLQFNDQFSATALGLVQDNDSGSGVEWLYLSYRPTNTLNIKLGQMQTPFYSLSDSLDVGYSYPWAIAPKEVYNDFVFKTFQGIDARYTFVVNDITAHIEAYYGGFDDDIYANDTIIETEVDELSGLISELRIANIKLRTSYHTGDVDLDLAETEQFADILSASGFNRSAASLNADGNTEFYQISAGYDSLTYFLKAEWVSINTSSDFLRDIQAYYLSYGYYFGKVTALITYARKKDKSVDAVDEIPIGVSEQLDQLAFGYQAIYAFREEDDIESWALDLRWDFRKNMALKAEYKHITSENIRDSAFLVDDGVEFDRTSNLLLLALEWVF